MKYFKVGQTVYHTKWGGGVVESINIEENTPILVDFNGSKKLFTFDGRYIIKGQIVLSQNPIPPIVNVPLEDEYIPYTFENMLIGMIVKHKDTDNVSIIVSQNKSRVIVGVTVFSYNDLLIHCTHLDGSPCGKLA